MRSIWYGLQNFWRFRRVIWCWRGWSFEYSYEVFVRALELQAGGIERYRNHESWKTDAAQIREAIAAWVAFQDDDMERYRRFPRSVEEHVADEQRCWDSFHDLCKKHGRMWWD